MTKSLQSRKRQLVEDAIYDAAIDLFAQQGFDETTIEEVADAAGISRRSFFRYFATKDDLLALNTVHCGDFLVNSLKSCPAGYDAIDVLRETVQAGVKFTESQKHTHQIIEIAARSVSARQAHASRWLEVEDKLTAAYTSLVKRASRDAVRPRLLAATTLLVLNNAVRRWYEEDYKDLSASAQQCLLNLTRLFSEESATSQGNHPAPENKASKSVPSKKSRSRKRIA